MITNDLDLGTAELLLPTLGGVLLWVAILAVALLPSDARDRRAAREGSVTAPAALQDEQDKAGRLLRDDTDLTTPEPVPCPCR
ncbi:hypothetical protein JOL79_27035 [Microbispora sp. RL4-1S]|uniref:Uncharacterized protein n=1 Tax=Microbispora oryzae TaxID=2806554 RepID=A0A940WU38_9ACTN|nr:hypothetical protein [Microbispora oryzae]MBP2707445.1 hypothetical protein [Microbispora oryzae]